MKGIHLFGRLVTIGPLKPSTSYLVDTWYRVNIFRQNIGANSALMNSLYEKSLFITLAQHILIWPIAKIVIVKKCIELNLWKNLTYEFA